VVDIGGDGGGGRTRGGVLVLDMYRREACLLLVQEGPDAVEADIMSLLGSLFVLLGVAGY